jgi:hypothetical protein
VWVWGVRPSKFIVRSLWTWNDLCLIVFVLTLVSNHRPAAGNQSPSVQQLLLSTCNSLEKGQIWFCQKFSWQICVPRDVCLILWCSAWSSEEEEECWALWFWMLSVMLHTIYVSRCFEGRSEPKWNENKVRSFLQYLLILEVNLNYVNVYMFIQIENLWHTYVMLNSLSDISF